MLMQDVCEVQSARAWTQGDIQHGDIRVEGLGRLTTIGGIGAAVHVKAIGLEGGLQQGRK